MFLLSSRKALRSSNSIRPLQTAKGVRAVNVLDDAAQLRYSRHGRIVSRPAGCVRYTVSEKLANVAQR